MNSFTDKRLRVTLILAEANAVFPGTNSNTLVIEGLRITASVRASARLTSQADISIYGMRSADMNAISIAWAIAPVMTNNLVILESNNTGRSDGWVQVFKGTINEAQPDYRSMPDVAFTLLASTGYWQKINPVEPASYPEPTTIGVIAADLVALMGDPWVLVLGDGVEGTLTNQYLSGTLWDQLTQACQAAKCDFYVQGDQILLTPYMQPRDTQPAVVLAPDSGLIGYPMYERGGLAVAALYDPAFLCGVALEIKSSTPNATGRWFPYSLQHVLESATPRGQWTTQMLCSKVAV